VTETGSQANARTRTRARFEVPEELRADVRLLGEILGRVLVEYAGQPLLDDVEKLRELTIAGDGEAAENLVASWPHERAEDVARAFTCYFHLTNLSEELHRARVLRERDRSSDAPAVSELAQAVEQISRDSGEQQARALLNGLEFRPVLTGHHQAHLLVAGGAERPAGRRQRAVREPAAPGRAGRHPLAYLATEDQPAHPAGRGPVGDGRLRGDAVRCRRQRLPAAGRRPGR
jgi:hypothetical protein